MIDPSLRRSCLTCEHFHFSNADPGYSEYTPSSPLHLGCYKGLFTFDPYNDDLRETLHTAVGCEKYEFATERAKKYRWAEDPNGQS